MKRSARSGISIALTLITALFAIPANAAPPSAGSQIVIGQRHQIHSTALSAPVTYLVHTPKFYGGTEQSYPVVILLDGSWHFAHVAATTDFLVEAEKIPQVILVGVDNVNRAANLSPPLPQADASNIPNDPTTPNADQYLRFISEELIPEIDRTYRTQHYRVLMGHSAAGVFVVYAFLQNARPLQWLRRDQPFHRSGVRAAHRLGALLPCQPPGSARRRVHQRRQRDAWATPCRLLARRSPERFLR